MAPLNFDKQISSVISSSFYHLLSKVKPFLNPKTLEMAVHAFITTRVDDCNSLYCGISKTQTESDHITPILKVFSLVIH